MLFNRYCTSPLLSYTMLPLYITLFPRPLPRLFSLFIVFAIQEYPLLETVVFVSLRYKDLLISLPLHVIHFNLSPLYYFKNYPSYLFSISSPRCCLPQLLTLFAGISSTTTSNGTSSIPSLLPLPSPPPFSPPSFSSPLLLLPPLLPFVEWCK